MDRAEQIKFRVKVEDAIIVELKTWLHCEACKRKLRRGPANILTPRYVLEWDIEHAL